MKIFPTARSLLARGLRSLPAWVLLAGAWMGAAQAQEAWPTRPVKLVVGFPAGGSTDVLARIYANRLSELLPQKMVVENRPGAGANLAAEAVARAPADGYTVLFTQVATHGIAPAVYPKLPYHPTRDFKPVTLLSQGPLLLMGSPKLGASNMAELQQWAKRQGRPLTIGYPGNGTSGHLASALLAQKSGIDLVLVPYKGGAPATQDLLGGQIDLLFDPLSSALGLVRGGQAKALGVTSEARNPSAPDLPALAETMPGFRVLTWFGFAMPAGTPQAVVNKLAYESARMAANPALRKQLTDMGLTTVGSTPSEFTSWIRRELDHWAGVAKAADIKME